MFARLTNLAYKLTTRDKIDAAIFGGYRRNYARVPAERIRETSAANAHFGVDAYTDFSTNTIERAKRYHHNIFEALGASNTEKLPFETIESRKIERFEQVPFNNKGKPLTPEEEKEYGLD